MLLFIVIGLTLTTVRNTFCNLKYSFSALSSANKKPAKFTHPKTTGGMRASTQLSSGDNIHENGISNNWNEGAYDRTIQPKIQEILMELEKQAALIEKLQKLIRAYESQGSVDTEVAKVGRASLSERSGRSPFDQKKEKKEKIAYALRQQASNIKQLDEVLEARKKMLSEILHDIQSMQHSDNFVPLPPAYSAPFVKTLNQKLDDNRNVISDISEELHIIQNDYKLQLLRQGNPEPTAATVPSTNFVGTSVSMRDLSGYKNTLDPVEDSDIPVFWHIPKAGGSTMKDIMGACYRLILASEAGILEGHADDTVSPLLITI